MLFLNKEMYFAKYIYDQHKNKEKIIDIPSLF